MRPARRTRRVHGRPPSGDAVVTASILWYLHDHGAGHLARARAVVPRLRSAVVVAAGPGIVSEARRHLDVPVVELPSDVPVVPAATTGPWHFAPCSAELRARGAALTTAIVEHGCTTAVVDVSMEVTVLARLLGLRVITVRQSGQRDDEPHRIGLSSADVVWVPQHPALEPIDGPVDQRWCFTGAFSRFDGVSRDGLRTQGGPRTAVLLVGAGGTALDAGSWRTAAAPTGWQVVIVGADARWCGDRVASIGRVDALLPLLAQADVVVTSAGWAAVADVVAAGARLVLVPEERPFAEQRTRSRALVAAGLADAVDRWPAPDDLSAVLDAAMDRRPAAWSTYHDGHGAERAAAMIDERHAT
jgi:hypothetical protein